APTSSVTTGLPDPGSGNSLKLFAAPHWEQRSSFEDGHRSSVCDSGGVGNISEVLLRTAFSSIAFEHLIVAGGTTASGRRTDWVDGRGGAGDGRLEADAATIGRPFLS